MLQQPVDLDFGPTTTDQESMQTEPLLPALLGETLKRIAEYVTVICLQHFLQSLKLWILSSSSS